MTTPTVVEPVPAPERPGVNLHMGASVAPAVSPEWTIGPWRLRFARLAAGGRLDLDPAAAANYVKVVCGRLALPDRGAYAGPKEVRSTRIDADHVVAGPDGALVAVFAATVAAVEPVRSLAALTVEGPHAELMRWQTFESRFAGIIDWYDGVDAHLTPGIHLLDDDGAEIAYVWIWAAGKGVDMVTHNHGNGPRRTSPAFAEVHWVMANGTGAGGMYETPEPGSAQRQRWVVQQGEEHGPFFAVDPATGRARLRPNGAVEYPWHSWEAGADDGGEPAYDVVVPFEITVPYAVTH